MLTVLIIRGATLSGAMEGVKFYMGTVDLAALKNPNVRFLQYLKITILMESFLDEFRFGKKPVHKYSML